MANMSYCRFRNTLADLEDCLEHVNDDLSDNSEEEEARLQLVQLCREIVEEHGEG